VTPRDQEEYSALRATIRQRGTARVVVFALGFTAWGALTLATVAFALPPVMALLPLAVLAATYESVLAIHVGAERIGRYLLVVHGDTWETYAGAFGRPSGSVAVDSLFTQTFVVGAVLSLLPLLTTTPIPQELIVVGASVLLFIARVLYAGRLAGRQRAVDTARFEEIKARPER
jgi:hypothetical protein